MEASGPSTAQRFREPPDCTGFDPWRLPVRNDPSRWSNARGLCHTGCTQEVTGYALGVPGVRRACGPGSQAIVDDESSGAAAHQGPIPVTARTRPPADSEWSPPAG